MTKSSAVCSTATGLIGLIFRFIPPPDLGPNRELSLLGRSEWDKEPELFLGLVAELTSILLGECDREMGLLV